jgi:hypothetical protein
VYVPINISTKDSCFLVDEGIKELFCSIYYNNNNYYNNIAELATSMMNRRNNITYICNTVLGLDLAYP